MAPGWHIIISDDVVLRKSPCQRVTPVLEPRKSDPGKLNMILFLISGKYKGCLTMKVQKGPDEKVYFQVSRLFAPAIAKIY